MDFIHFPVSTDRRNQVGKVNISISFYHPRTLKSIIFVSKNLKDISNGSGRLLIIRCLLFWLRRVICIAPSLRRLLPSKPDKFWRIIGGSDGECYSSWSVEGNFPRMISRRRGNGGYPEVDRNRCKLNRYTVSLA